MDFPKRKPTRLRSYDYSRSGYYFITICSHNRRELFSHIVGQGLAPAAVHLSPYGKIAERELLNSEKRYNNIKIDKYVIMPNHIHAIVIIENNISETSAPPTLSDVVCSFKSITSHLCKKEGLTEKIFQTSFHDHIIRGEKDYEKIWTYIDGNPSEWKNDCFYCE